MGWDVGGGSRERGHIYTYGWFMLMYGLNQHNIVKQLSSNLNKLKKNLENVNVRNLWWQNTDQWLLGRGVKDYKGAH